MKFNMSVNILRMQPCPKTLLNWVKFDFIISTFFQKPAFFPILAKKNYQPMIEEKATKGTKIALQTQKFGLLLTHMQGLMGHC